MNTPGSRSRALLLSVTFWDHRCRFRATIFPIQCRVRPMLWGKPHFKMGPKDIGLTQLLEIFLKISFEKQISEASPSIPLTQKPLNE